MRDINGDQSRLFRATRALLLPKDDLCFPVYVDSAVLANGNYWSIFPSKDHQYPFFYRKIINIHTDLDASVIETQGWVHYDAVFDGD